MPKFFLHSEDTIPCPLLVNTQRMTEDMQGAFPSFHFLYFEASGNRQPAGSGVSLSALCLCFRLLLINAASYLLPLQPFNMVQFLSSEDFCHLQAFWI